MTGRVINAYIGARRHLRLCREEQWGERPESPQWVACPIWGDGYTVRQTSMPHTPALNVGGYRRRWVTPLMKRLEGELATRIFRGQAAFLLEGVLARDENWDLRSFTAQHYSPVETIEQRGLVFARARISGDAPSGRLTFSALLCGKHEERMAEGAPAASDFSYDDEIPFSFQHGLAALPDGGATAPIEAFALDIDNEVSAGPAFSDYEPIFLKGGRRSVSGWIKFAHDTGEHEERLRNFQETSLLLAFVHPLGGQGGRIEIRLPRVWLKEARRSGGAGDIIRQTLYFMAFAPEDGEEIAISIT